MSQHQPIAFPSWDPAVDQGQFGSSLHGTKVLACNKGHCAPAKPATIVSVNHYIQHAPWGSANDNSITVKFDGQAHSATVPAKHVWPVVNGTNSGGAIGLGALGESDGQSEKTSVIELHELIKTAKQHILDLCEEKKRLLAKMHDVSNENNALKQALVKSRQDGITQNQQLAEAQTLITSMRKRSMELETAAVAAQQMLQDETNPLPQR